MIQAIKSGRPYRRESLNIQWFTKFIRSKSGCGLQFTNEDGAHYWPDPEDILADDWEIQEPKVTITRAQFWAAAPHFVATDHTSVWKADVMNGMMEELARNLGLECPHNHIRSGDPGNILPKCVECGQRLVK